jgi:hypothetical protein
MGGQFFMSPDRQEKKKARGSSRGRLAAGAKGIRTPGLARSAPQIPAARQLPAPAPNRRKASGGPEPESRLVGSARSLRGYDDCTGSTLHDPYGAAEIPDSFDPGETAGLRVPSPGRELHPAVAGNGKGEVNRPAKVQNRHSPASRDIGGQDRSFNRFGQRQIVLQCSPK